MAEVEFEAVLEFLRENGLSECESALMEDIMENKSGFQRFYFATASPPPLLRIQATGGGSSKGSSDDGDEFVSLGSSDFANPYGVRTKRPTSQASSDRLSQFGTARDYLDFDMQNDLFVYDEKDEECAVPPFFDDSDFNGGPSEDKFIMTLQEREAVEDQHEYNLKCEGNTNYSKYETYKDYCELATFEENDFNNCKKDREPVEIDDFDILDDKVIAGESCQAESAIHDKSGGVSDELRIYDNMKDDYEIFDLRIIHRKNRTGFEENKEFPIVVNSIIAGRYHVTEFLGSSAFSRVVQARDLYSGLDVCLKIIKNDKDFFDQSLDEIKLLKFINKQDPADEHHILRLYDYFYHQEHLFIVTELLLANLYEFQLYNRESGAEPYFTLHRLQAITRQCLEALSYLHDLGIVHCDLKPENILIQSYQRCEIKVIDFGSSCFHTDNFPLYIQSRSYRAPEVMLGLHFDQKIDLWSVGCILAELYSGEVLFPNEPVGMVVARIIGMLGPIDMDMLQKGEETHKYFTKEYDLYYINEDTNQLEYIIPDESSLKHQLQISDSVLLDLLMYLLEINPKRRPTAREALEHPWFSRSYGI